MPEACCLICRSKITINADSGREYGHAHGRGYADGKRCPRRRDYCDPQREIPGRKERPLLAPVVGGE